MCAKLMTATAFGILNGTFSCSWKRRFPHRSIFCRKRIAITVGSHVIPHLAQIVQVLCNRLKEWCALPFLVPAMGSHAGGTAEGQTAQIRKLGITKQSIGIPILSSMETVYCGSLEDGTP